MMSSQRSSKGILMSNASKSNMVSKHNPRSLKPSDLANCFSGSKNLKQNQSAKKMGGFSQKLHNASYASSYIENSKFYGKESLVNDEFDSEVKISTGKFVKLGDINENGQHTSKA